MRNPLCDAPHLPGQARGPWDQYLDGDHQSKSLARGTHTARESARQQQIASWSQWTRHNNGSTACENSCVGHAVGYPPSRQHWPATAGSNGLYSSATSVRPTWQTQTDGSSSRSGHMPGSSAKAAMPNSFAGVPNSQPQGLGSMPLPAPQQQQQQRKQQQPWHQHQHLHQHLHQQHTEEQQQSQQQQQQQHQQRWQQQPDYPQEQAKQQCFNIHQWQVPPGSLATAARSDARTRGSSSMSHRSLAADNDDIGLPGELLLMDGQAAHVIREAAATCEAAAAAGSIPCLPNMHAGQYSASDTAWQQGSDPLNTMHCLQGSIDNHTPGWQTGIIEQHQSTALCNAAASNPRTASTSPGQQPVSNTVLQHCSRPVGSILHDSGSNKWPGGSQHEQQQRPAQQCHAISQQAASRWSNKAAVLHRPVQPGAVLKPATAAAAAGSIVTDSTAKAAQNATIGQQIEGQGSDSSSCRRGSRGGKAGRSQRCRDTLGRSSSSGITMEFVQHAPGSKPQQPKMHQESIIDTLKRAGRNKDQQQQSISGSTIHQQHCSQLSSPTVHEQAMQLQGAHGAAQAAVSDVAISAQEAAAPGDTACTAVGKPPKPAVGKKRKRANTAAADEIIGDMPGGSSRRNGSKSSQADKEEAAASALLEEATELLDLACVSSAPDAASGCILNLRSAAVMQQLQYELQHAPGVALGVLYRTQVAAQYFSSLQPLTKHQQQLVSKVHQASRRAAAKAVAAAAADDAAPEEDHRASAAADDVIVGVAILPVTVANAQQVSAASSICHKSSSRMYYLHLQPGNCPACQTAGRALSPPQQQGLPAAVFKLLQDMVQNAGQRPCICCNAKQVLCSLLQLGLQLPPAAQVTIIDPEVLGWLHDPQLVQDSKQDSKQGACYSLVDQLQRYGLQVAPDTDVQHKVPLQRLYDQMQQSVHVADYLHLKLQGQVTQAAVKMEMQVAAILAKLESVGVPCDPSFLLSHHQTLLKRLSAIGARAAQLAGQAFNLGSSSQLSRVLYEDLRLPPPSSAGKGAAKTHLPTDEQTLKQLASIHELPGLVMEYRCMRNVTTKWMEPGWVQQAAREAANAAAATAQSNQATNHAVARVHCCWNQLATATGRLSSCAPNLQAVTKYTIAAPQMPQQQHQQQQHPQHVQQHHQAAPHVLSINIRDAFVAPEGKLLLSADYSQIELRLLAHFSGDLLLQQVLRQSGAQGDVFSLIAAAWQPGLTVPGRQMAAVTGAERERAKRTAYGIVYGVSPFGLAQHLSDQGVNQAAAGVLIDSFLARFPGVKQYMDTCLSAAQETGVVHTLIGRVRPITGLTSTRYQDRAAAKRKVVNSIIQGSAADLIKLAMCAWDQWEAQALAAGSAANTSASGSNSYHHGVERSVSHYCSSNNSQFSGACHASKPVAAATATGSSRGRFVGARLIAQIHDELLFELDAPDAVLDEQGNMLNPGNNMVRVADAVRDIMQNVANVAVPLRVRIGWGKRWGSMQSIDG